jgi:hypothetical protein
LNSELPKFGESGVGAWIFWIVFKNAACKRPRASPNFSCYRLNKFVYFPSGSYHHTHTSDRLMWTFFVEIRGYAQLACFIWGQCIFRVLSLSTTFSGFKASSHFIPTYIKLGNDTLFAWKTILKTTLIVL